MRCPKCGKVGLIDYDALLHHCPKCGNWIRRVKGSTGIKITK